MTLKSCVRVRSYNLFRWTTRVQFRRAAASNSHATSATVESTWSSQETRRDWPLLSAHQITRGALRKWIGKVDSGGRALEMRTRVRLLTPVLWRQCLVYGRSADNTGREVHHFGTVGGRLEPRRVILNVLEPKNMSARTWCVGNDALGAWNFKKFILTSHYLLYIVTKSTLNRSDRPICEFVQ